MNPSENGAHPNGGWNTVWFSTSMNAKCLIRNLIERIGQRQTTSGGNGVMTLLPSKRMVEPIRFKQSAYLIH